MDLEVATYISFPGNAKEAFNHYHEVLGGDLNVMTYGNTPMEGMPFEPNPDSVAHATLSTSNGTIAGGDAMEDGNDYPLRGTAYSLLITAESTADAESIIAKFVSGGGSIQMPFEPAPWGGHYGSVFDRFGVMWALFAE